MAKNLLDLKNLPSISFEEAKKLQASGKKVVPVAFNVPDEWVSQLMIVRLGPKGNRPVIHRVS